MRSKLIQIFNFSVEAAAASAAQGSNDVKDVYVAVDEEMRNKVKKKIYKNKTLHVSSLGEQVSL